MKPVLPAAADLARDVITSHALLTHADTPFSYFPQAGKPEVVVLAGDNASGKSMLLDMMASRSYHEHGVEPIVVSMRARTSEGMLRALTYGAESSRATGQVSVGVSLRALRALPSRLENQSAQTLIVLDEPDFGLSEGYAYPFGLKIANELNALPNDGRWGVLLASHSRELVRGFLDGLGQTPTFIHTGEPLTIDAWLAQSPRRTVQDLDDMLERATQYSKSITRVQNALKEAKQAEAKKENAEPFPSSNRQTRPKRT